METKSALSLRNVSFSHDRDPLFAGVSLELGHHEFVTIMGKNGIGKSTLISLLLGVHPPDGGEIHFFGRHLSSVSRAELGQRVSWVISDREFYPPLFKVRELFDRLRGFYPSWDPALERKLIDGFGIDIRKELVTLSLGEAAKVKLIKALAIRPELIILDELTANLDQESKSVVTRELIDLFASTKKMAVLYVSHLEDEALRLSDRVLHLEANGLKISA